MNENPPAKSLATLAYASAVFLYLHLMVFIAVFGVAIILNYNKGNKFASFHIRQMFGIAIVAIIVSVFADNIPKDQLILPLLIITLMVLLALLGLISTLRNQQALLPFIGKYFQKWFTFIK
ncbi:hypothetical protein [Nonlabens sp.]|uniref:hypothetical protein n=1 Tax=Nonlabens sp. TaxID=1888209 RepID=UPI001BCB3A2E|nr:hypothetical protein [Nonlabens sp.]